MKTPLKILKNQSGALTLDFVFAFILVMGTTLVFGMFCFTLSIIETVQYTAFASSRAYFAGHLSKQDQERYAAGVYNELKNKKLKFFLRDSWFSINPKWDDVRSNYPHSNENSVFTGSYFNVEAKILDFAVPFIGSTQRDNGYKTIVTSFLGREPSAEECSDMINQRWELIKKMDGGLYSKVQSNGYVGFDDNGC